jgi:hypothetical protein
LCKEIHKGGKFFPSFFKEEKMRKTQKERDAINTESALLQGAVLTQEEPKATFDFETFEFKNIEDFDVYNANVRKHNRLCVHERNKMKVKVPDESFHKKVKIKFQRFDQPYNVLKTIVRTKEIEWKGQLRPGGIYDLPVPVVKFLNKLAVPTFAEVKVDDGGEMITETRQVGEVNRFSCQVLDF